MSKRPIQRGDNLHNERSFIHINSTAQPKKRDNDVRPEDGTADESTEPGLLSAAPADLYDIERALSDADLPTVKLWDIELVRVRQGELYGQQLLATDALIVLLEGEGTLERGSSVARLYADTVYRCAQQSTFGLRAAGEKEALAAIVRFGLFAPVDQSRSVLHAADTDSLLGLPDESVVEPSGKLAARCRSMYEHARSEDALLRWRAHSELQELLFDMMDACRAQERSGASSALERVKHWMEERYMEEVTVERLAGIAQLSPKYFADLFKKTYGISALDMLLDIRMGKAKQLMLRTGLRLRDIAHEVGYEDEFYFSRKFKKTYRISPSEYIKQRKRKIAAYGGISTLGYLTALNVVPHAAPLHPKWSGFYYDRYRTDIPYPLDAYRQNHHRKANLDVLAEAKPELIVCTSDLEPWEKPCLAEIAATLSLPKDGPHAWKQGMRDVAAALDRREEAESWIAAYERRNEELRARVAEGLKEQSVMVVRMLGETLYSYTNQTIEDVLYGDMGIRRPAALNERSQYGRRLTLEQLEAVRADYVLLLVCQESETLSHWQRLRQSGEWLSLTAVHHNRLKLIPSHPWREYSPVGVELTRAGIVKLFSGKSPS